MRISEESNLGLIINKDYWNDFKLYVKKFYYLILNLSIFKCYFKPYYKLVF